MKVAVIGAGYVGLVTGVCLAAVGHQVACVDKKAEVVESINQRRSPLYEPGLAEILCRVVEEGRLQAFTDTSAAVNDAEVIIIAVGTPLGPGGIDLSYILASAREIGTALREREGYSVVVVKSTVIPGTTGETVRKVLEAASGMRAGEFGLAMNPEFLREGSAVEDFMYPDRIIIGAWDERSCEVLRRMYTGFDAPVLKVNLAAAEMIKYTANALLASLVSFANETACICEAAGGIDVQEVLSAVTLDKRFSPRIDGELVRPGMIQYLRAGCGFGGSCFPKDLGALLSFSREKGYDPRLVESIIQVNQKQPHRIVQRLEGRLGNLAEKKVAVLGLAFKPGTDDVRETPSLPIIRDLRERGAVVAGADPVARENMADILPAGPGLRYTGDWETALEGSSAAILVTPWPDYVEISGSNYRRLMKFPLVMDCRRVLDRGDLEAAGCHYLGVGLVPEQGGDGYES